MTPLASRKDYLHYVIVGNSAAGIAAAREIRRCDPMGRITMISDEPTFGYSRVMLPLLMAGKIRTKDMWIGPKEFYASLRIRLFREDAAVSLEPREQMVQTAKGRRFSYDRLLIATGSSPRRLGIPGRDLEGVHYLRKMSDVKAIKAELRSHHDPVLVVGGGLVGVKSLEALVARKKKVHLVISSDRILSQMIDRTTSDFFLRAFQRQGVSVHLCCDVQAFRGTKHLEGAVLSDGTTLPCRMAVIGKGVCPNIDLPLSGGIAVQEGVLVDGHMATNIPSVYAAGDVAEPLDVLTRRNIGIPIWPLALETGRVAGSNMAGVPSVFSGGLRMNSVEVLGVRAVSAGDWEGEDVRSFEKGSLYRKLVFSQGKLRGFVLAGEIRSAGVLTWLIRNQTEVSPSALEAGLHRGFSYWPRFQILQGQICNCGGV
jgi:nitrite reductase (NADH) large subunit